MSDYEQIKPLYPTNQKTKEEVFQNNIERQPILRAEYLKLPSQKPSSHPYTDKKRLPLVGNVKVGEWYDNSEKKIYKNTLYIPMMDTAGKIWSYQTINTERPKPKKFAPGGRVIGTFWACGVVNPTGYIYIGEGWATMACIRHILNVPVVATFSSYNLLPTIKEVLKRYPKIRIILAADEDLWTLNRQNQPWNPGREYAKKVKDLFPSTIVVHPKFSKPQPPTADSKGFTRKCKKGSTDFCDLYLDEGRESVSTQLLMGDVDPMEKFKPTSDKKFLLFTADELYHAPKMELRWLINNLLPTPGTSLIGGKSKTGKTTIVRQLAKEIIEGTDFLGRKTLQGKVLYVNLEDPIAIIQRHIRKLSLDSPNLTFISAPIRAPKPFDLIATVIKNMGVRYELIVLDTIIKAFPSLAEKSDAYGSVAIQLQPMSDLAQELGSHIIGVHHKNKSGKSGSAGLMGSEAWAAAVDTIMLVDREKRIENGQETETSRRTISTIQRVGPEIKESFLHWNEGTGRVVMGLDTSEEKIKAKKKEILDQIPFDKWIVTRSIGGVSNEQRMPRLNSLAKEGLVRIKGTGKAGDALMCQRIEQTPRGEDHF